LKGYQGMVDGGDCIEQAEWKTVSGIIQKVSWYHLLPLPHFYLYEAAAADITGRQLDAHRHLCFVDTTTPVSHRLYKTLQRASLQVLRNMSTSYLS